MSAGQASVGQQYWDTSYTGLPLRYDEEQIQFRDLFRRVVTPGGSCFEVGCYPGTYLVHFGRNYGFTVNGIDRTPFVRDRLPQFLAGCGVRFDDLVCADFLSYRTDRRFDLVYSNGFVEHYRDFRHIVGLHADLVAPGGVLVVTAPNFRRVQYALHAWLDAENLQRHVTAAMDTAAWADVLVGRGFRVLETGHYRTFEFWADSRQGAAAAFISRLVRGVGRRIDARVNLPNRWTSPYMYLAARRQD